MASILKVNEIQHTGGASAITVDSSGNIASSQPIIQVAVFARTGINTYNSGAFRDRVFNRISSGSITGASVNGSGAAVLPAGTYFIQYVANAVTSSGQQGETVSRLYDNAASAIVANSYSVRSTQAADTTDSTLNLGSIQVTFGAQAEIIIQTLSENGNFLDANTFDSTPGNALANQDGKIGMQMTVMKLA